MNYDIDVTLIDSLRSMTGTATITYVNHSPDELDVLWFHLPPAALQGGSVVDQTRMRSRDKHWSRQPEATWGDLKVGQVRSLDGRTASFDQDYSIGQLHLDPPIQPGDSASFVLPFTTRFPTGGSQSRMGYSRGQYKGAYWYPQICPYTPEFGWTVNRYFGTGEAYGEFGDFTIRYTVPYKYIIASTGELVNESEVLPPERMKGLTLGNPFPTPIPEGEEGVRPITWIFQADQVPDVTFAMDPKFLIDRVDFGHFEAWSFSRRDQTDDWSDAAEVCGWTIQQLEEIYGPYPWPRVQASYSWSAMEYPMLTLMSWSSPQYVQVMIHEVVHNYTPMILHSNSQDEQWIDEGFTTYLEHVLLTKYEGTEVNKYRTYSRGLFSEEMIVRDADVRGQRPYLEAVLAGEDLPMVRASDTADDYPLLRVSSYYKGPVMLNTLRGVIGDEAFWRGFKILYQRHALTHVSSDDVVSSFEDASGQSLKWFFDQFLYSAVDLDYALENVDLDRNPSGGNTLRFTVHRKDEMKIPPLIGVITTDGDTLRGAVPFLPTDVVPEGYEAWGSWDQWHMPNARIRIEVQLPGDMKPAAILLDPDGFWTDRDPANNHWPWQAPKLAFDPILTPQPLPDLERWQMNVSPAMGYNLDTRLMAGLSVRGSYLEREDILLADVLIPSNNIDTYLPQYRVGFATPINRDFGPTYGTVYFGNMHGDAWGEIGLRRSWRKWNSSINRITWSIKAGSWERYNSTLNATLSAPGSERGTLITGSNPLARVAVPPALNHQYASQAGATPYLRAKANFAGRFGRIPWKEELHWTIGLDDDFNVATWSIELAGSLPLGWELGTEARASVANGSAPARFIDAPGGAAPYEVMGSPLYGGAWNTVDLNLPPVRSPQSAHYSRLPRPHAPASLASDLGAVYTDRFLALRFSQLNKLPQLLRRTGQVHVDRFLDRIRLGIFESGMLFRNIRSNDVAFGGELGVEAGLVDFYGLSFSARLAPVYASDDYERTLDEIHSWTGQDFLDHTVVYVNLNLDPYFR
ncbi:hypothetical protein KQI52_01800 [bacterium]|nr:hypothetical protein [bacterium]